VSVDALEPHAHRSRLGVGARWLAAGPGGSWQQGDGYWWALSGAPSPDVNLAAVWTPDLAVLRQVEAAVREAGCPAVLSLAGPARSLSDQLGEQWSPVGSLPVMALPLEQAARRTDARVRLATPDDVDALTGLVGAAYGLGDEAAGAALRAIGAGDEGCAVHTLVEDGRPVSAVVVSRAEEAVTVWCMATPPGHARRGFGRALLGDVLARAAAEGAQVGLLGATPAGEPLYRATGWQVLEEWALYVDAASAQFV
jgi:GNAT superfamily N-acetyltransferase